MPEIVIRYCVPCRYRAQAIGDADAILEAFGQELTAVRLVPGDAGVYDVELDGTLLFSLDKEMRFPDPAALIETIRASLATRDVRKGSP